MSHMIFANIFGSSLTFRRELNEIIVRIELEVL